MTAPTTIPAIAPVERPREDFDSMAVGDGLDTDTDADADADADAEVIARELGLAVISSPFEGLKHHYLESRPEYLY